MKKLYELTIIAPTEMTVLEKMELDRMLKRYCWVNKQEIDGKRRLAYPINGRECGLLMYYEIETDKPVELNHELERNNSVIRYLLVTKDIQEYSSSYDV